MTAQSTLLSAHPAVSMKTKITKTDASYHINQMVLDSDSANIGVDNRCTSCISHESTDFIGELQTCNRAIKGFGGTQTPLIKRGTILWKWDDDQGLQHKFPIPNSFYVPSGKCRLLSPQHWAQLLPKEKRTETTSTRNIVLTWGNGAYTKTMELGGSDKVGTFRLSPGFQQYHKFCVAAATSEWDESNPMTTASAEVTDEETELPTTRNSLPQANRQWNPGQPPDFFLQCHPLPEDMTAAVSDEEAPQPEGATANHEEDLAAHNNTHFPETATDNPPSAEAGGGSPPPDSNQSPRIAPFTIPDLTRTEEGNHGDVHSDSALLLRYHYKYGHISFARLRRMAQQRTLPYRLRNLDSPTCAACLYGKAKRRPWRGPSRKNFSKTNKVTRPGQVVSVDQLVSPTPGFIAQMTGILTTKRYKYATVYVDHFSKFSYLYLQKTGTAEETVEGKQAFERYAAENGVKIEHYHADNGIFRAHGWIND